MPFIDWSRCRVERDCMGSPGASRAFAWRLVDVDGRVIARFWTLGKGWGR